MSDLEAQSYAEFSAGLHRRVAGARIPTSATFEVTRRCPLVCRHCYNNLPLVDRQARAAELTVNDHRRLLDELAELGCLWVLYTGGEIFARPDFLEIYDHARHRGFLITLFTNGTLITAAIADHLRVHRPFSIEITLYGATRGTYEDLTGVPGSYDRCLRGIDLLLERGLPLKLKTVAVTLNKHEIEAMRRFAENRGVEFKFDAMMSPRVDCSQSPLEVRLAPDECVELDLRDERRVKEWRMFADRFISPGRPVVRADEVYHCGGGVNSFAVDPYGGMSLCVLSQSEKFDLKIGSVQDGWQQFLHRVREKKASRVTKCTSCALKAMCGMCPANGELENGDPEEPVDFLCQVAHLRAYAFELDVPAHGDCEYCAGGTGHDRLIASLDRIRPLAKAPPAHAHGRSPALSVLRAAPAPNERGCGTGHCVSCRTDP